MEDPAKVAQRIRTANAAEMLAAVKAERYDKGVSEDSPYTPGYAKPTNGEDNDL